ncbi:DUF5000 domain-containing lipoprotein [Niabella drilacis]|uniref:F5/8 type C domain-containing protein n=1 Tax=Niabella drilacis (strain DSM 25811 / CCM 8410 / CCUG 62505 / LMG 26954 / E90) TaxID=1285928 RepID=A0A1G6R8P9_NIADE|nr:DUF5000 domain-containing lipoprotein [Niabella drilacis]SDD00465.1 protein of unknown function [Niabella drilacis]
MKKIYTYAVWGLLLLGTGCAKEDVKGPRQKGEKPAPVTQYKVTSLSGAAEIKFRMPVSEDLLYVKATYKLNSGKTYEAKSSLYKDYLIVEGFDRAGEYDVTLNAVAKGEVYSDPVTVKVTVSEPPYLLTRNSLNLAETFGGVYVSFLNAAEGDLSIRLLDKDSTGKWREKTTYYSNARSAFFSARGYNTDQRDFGVFVKDKWGNTSDTLVKKLTPVFEESIPKTTWKKFELPGDNTAPHPTYTQWYFERMWDNSLGSDNMFHTAPLLAVWPEVFTIDLGVNATLSRMKLFQRQSSIYNANNVKTFEVYGSNSPGLDGSWDSWTKLGSYEVIKPSGSALGTNSAEDTQVAKDGHDFEFPPIYGAFRYIRFRVLSTWGNQQSMAIAELSFWGKIGN